MLATYLDMTKTAPFADANRQSISNQNHSTLNPKFIFVLGFIILFLLGAAWGINTLIRNFDRNLTKSAPAVLQQNQNKTNEELEKNLPAISSAANDTSIALTTTRATFQNFSNFRNDGE